MDITGQMSPGPWIYHEPDEQAGIGYEITKYPYTNHRVGEADREADARAIAALPELVEALREADKLNEDLLNGHTVSDDRAEEVCAFVCRTLVKIGGEGGDS